ncbi:MAG: enoyl-CoA hydratase-related protein [Acidimicrobiia bacterium]
MEHVHTEIRDRVAVVTLDRPPVNALSYQTFEEIAQTMESLSSGRDASVIVLRAAPDARVFCGGVDLQDSPRRHRPDGRAEDGGVKGDARDQVDPGRIARRCFNSIYECGLPVIAAVHGKAIGAGVPIVASCDLVVASTEASFALTEINVGVLGGVRHAQRLCGPFLAKRMFLTGEFVSADEIFRRGGIEAVVEPDQLLDTAMLLAATIATKSPIAVRLAKESANRVEPMPLLDGYRTEQDYTQRVKRHADSEEARSAFMEKRPPRYAWE